MLDERRYGVTTGPLHDFTALTHPSIGIQFLLGCPSTAPFRLVRALTPNLHNLTLRGYKKGINAQIDADVEELSETKGGIFSHRKIARGIDEGVSSTKCCIDEEDKEL